MPHSGWNQLCEISTDKAIGTAKAIVSFLKAIIPRLQLRFDLRIRLRLEGGMIFIQIWVTSHQLLVESGNIQHQGIYQPTRKLQTPVLSPHLE